MISSSIHGDETAGFVLLMRLAEYLASGGGGAPATPLRLLVEGRWIEGETTRRLGPPAADLLARLG